MKNTYIKLAIGAMLFATWLGLILFNIHGAEDLITAIKAALFGLGVYHLGDRPGPPPAPAGRESGRASLLMMITLAAGALLLAGCASVQQALNGYESAASVSIDAANDNAVKVWKYQACQIPVSAAIRNPDVVPAIKALCVPGSSSSTAASLLDATAIQPAPTK